MLIGPRPSRSSHPRRCDFLPGKRKRRAAPARGGRAKREKQIEIETISSRHAVCLLDFLFAGRKEKTVTPDGATVFLVGEGGFEPPKSLTTDLQSAPFGHSGIPPYSLVRGAGRRIRTPDLLITNQLLYQLSYTSISATNKTYVSRL